MDTKKNLKNFINIIIPLLLQENLLIASFTRETCYIHHNN